MIGKTLDADAAAPLPCVGSEVRAQGGDAVVVARDGRLSGPELIAALSDGLRATGVDVVNVGMVPTPVGYFAASVPLKLAGGERRIDSCIVVTGSHNPPDYNGFKMVLSRRGHLRRADPGAAPADRRRQFRRGRRHLCRLRHRRRVPRAHRRDIKLARPVKIVVDTGNGVAGGLAPRLFKALGCEIVELFTDIDGHVPESPSRSGAPGKPAGRDSRAEGNRRRSRLRVRRRRRPPRRWSRKMVRSSIRIASLMLFAEEVLSRQRRGADHL